MSRALTPQDRVGELDERIELQKETVTSDGMGGQTREWVTQATVWASVRALSGSERLHSDQLQTAGGYRIAIRNRTDLDVTAAWRVKWRGKTYNIRFPQDSGPRDMYLVLEIEGGVAT